MNCTELSELSSLYLSRELEADCVEEFRRHLDACPSCAAAIGRMTELDARLREAIASEPVDTAAIEQRVRDHIAGPSRRWIGLAASFAAAVVIAGIGSRVWWGQDRTCADAAGDHRDEVVGGAPRTWRSDSLSIGELAERQGISPAAVARLAPEVFQLEHAKLCRLDGHTFLHLVYAGGAEKISVFLRARDGAASAGIRTIEVGAEHVAYFDTDRVSAIIVSDHSQTSAMQVARFAERVL